MDDSVPCCRDEARGEGDHVIQEVQGNKIRCCCLFVVVLLFLLASLLDFLLLLVKMYIYMKPNLSL